MVITGMHGALVTFAVMIISQNAYETLITPVMYTYNYAVFGVALGAALKLKNKENKRAAFEYFTTCIIGGVTEPILYGILIKYKKTLLALLVAGLVGGIYVGVFAPQSYMMATVSIIGTWSQYINGGTMNFINGCVSIAVSFSAGVAAAYMVDYDEN